MDMMFDTGSAQTWVYTKEGCSKNGGSCPNVGKYSLDKSTTDKRPDPTQQIQLKFSNAGFVNGTVVTDKFCLNPDKSTSCIPQLTFLGADYSSNMNQYDASGFIGLAPNSNINQLPAFI